MINEMDGYERLKQLYRDDGKNDNALNIILEYLIKVPDMSEVYLNQEKNLTQMMSYINRKAKEQAVNNVAVIEDETVYNWSLEYFKKGNEELGLNDPIPITLKTKVEKKEDKPTGQLSLELEF